MPWVVLFDWRDWPSSTVRSWPAWPDERWYEEGVECAERSTVRARAVEKLGKDERELEMVFEDSW